MKLFLIGWSGKDLGLNEVVYRLQNAGHKIVYWTCSNIDEIDAKDFPDTIFHYSFDALYGIPAKELENNNFPPPDENLLKQLGEAESIVLTMMNKRFEGWPISKRKRLYYTHVRYWQGVLKKFKPDAILLTSMPHTVYDYVVYCLARLLNIRTIMLETTWLGDRLLLLEDFKKGCEMLSKEAERNINRQFSLSDLSEDFQNYLKLLGITPLFLGQMKSQYSGYKFFVLKLKIVLNSIKDLTIFRKILEFLKKRLGKNIIKEYRSIQIEPDFSKKFVYLPLHFQPERNSSPQGGFYVDQILMVETLSSVLPDGWLIYVKEHPYQWPPRGLNFSDYRYPGYYQAMAKIKNVRLIPVETDANHLINAAQAVATIAGTTALEAIFRFKPALVFGYIWYQDFPGIYKVRDVESCKNALEKIRNGLVHNQQEILNYLKILDKVSFHGYMEDFGAKISNLTPDQNAASIFNALTEKL